MNRDLINKTYCLVSQLNGQDGDQKTIKRSYLRVVIHKSLSLDISPSLGIYGHSYILPFVLFGESFLQSAFNFRAKYC